MPLRLRDLGSRVRPTHLCAEIEIWVWPPGQKKMQLLASATLKSKDGAARTLLQRERTMLMSFVKERMGRASPPTTDEYGGPPGALRYFATMAAMDPNEIPRPLFALLVHVVEPGVKGVREEQWLVSHAFGDAEDVAYAAHPRQRTEKITLMPYCSIAALLASRAAGAPKQNCLSPCSTNALATPRATPHATPTARIGSAWAALAPGCCVRGRRGLGVRPSVTWPRIRDTAAAHHDRAAGAHQRAVGDLFRSQLARAG